NREGRRSRWEKRLRTPLPVPARSIPQSEEAGTRVPASPAIDSFMIETRLAPLFLLRSLLGPLLRRLLFRLRFLGGLLLARGFFLRRFFGALLGRRFGRGPRGGRHFFRLLAHHSEVFLCFDDLFGFADQFLVVFQP